MAKRYFLTVKQIIRETPDAVTITFSSPVHDDIRYESGQFLTFLLPINGATVRRSYSLCSAPGIDESLAVSVKRIPGGLASTYLVDRLRPGDTLETLAPMGTFVLNPAAQHGRSLVLIGAGSGITPLFSMVKSILHTDPDTRVWLIYGNRNQGSTLFNAQLDTLQQVYPWRTRVTHVLSQPSADWSGLTGRLDGPLLTTLLSQWSADERAQASVYLCGPEAMMADARLAMNQGGISAERIYLERFVTAASGGNEPVEAAMEPTCEDAFDVILRYEGQQYTFAVHPNQTILQAALDLAIDLPYSCQLGTCSTCLAKCTSGAVRQDEEASLSVADRQAGYVLTCVAYPVSQQVVIEV